MAPSTAWHRWRRPYLKGSTLSKRDFRWFSRRTAGSGHEARDALLGAPWWGTLSDERKLAWTRATYREQAGPLVDLELVKKRALQRVHVWLWSVHVAEMDTGRRDDCLQRFLAVSHKWTAGWDCIMFSQEPTVTMKLYAVVDAAVIQSPACRLLCCTAKLDWRRQHMGSGSFWLL